MHFIMATVLFFVCFSFIGVQTKNKWYIARPSKVRRRQGGLVAGDRILSITVNRHGFIGGRSRARPCRPAVADGRPA